MKNFGFWFLNGLGFGCGFFLVAIVLQLFSIALG